MRMPFYYLLLISFSLCSCSLFNNNEIEFFKVTPISAVEVALEIRADSGDEISIERDGNEIFSFRMSRKDTVVYDSGLSPNTSYIWKVINKSSRRNKSKERQATTLTTTSSEFTWQTYSFGDHSSSVLYGVSIVDENNIWAVGEIYMNDSTGQADDDRYNAIHWNGTNWTLKRITVQFRQNMITPKMNDIVTFSAENIWLSSGVPVYGNGTDWTQYHLFDMGILDDSDGGVVSIWGNNSEDIFFGGALGTLTHYNGQDWQKIETGTELEFYDIHGNEQQGVVAIAANQSQSSDKLILRINEDLTTEPLSTEPIPFSISGIRFDDSGVTYVVGSRVSVKPDIDSSSPWNLLSNVDHPYLFAIDANGLNDIVATGGFGEIVHFNGADWVLYEQGTAGNLYDIDIQGNLMVVVGYDGGKAFITMGRRE